MLCREETDMTQDMHALLARQKAAHLRDGAPSAELRIERIDRCIAPAGRTIARRSRMR